MTEQKNTFSCSIDCTALPFDLCKSVFFDIETTGLSSKKSRIYMIGILYTGDSENFTAVQFFNDDGDEAALLHAFFDAVKDFENLIHFNGTGFDVPFILAKCSVYGIPNGLEHLTSFDLYKSATRYKELFKRPNCKQKTLEAFFGLEREDVYSGGELIAIYQEYRKKKDKSQKELLLLHNFEDIKGMLTLLSLYAYDCAFAGEFSFVDSEICDYTDVDGQMQKELFLNFRLRTAVPQKVSGGNDIFYLMISGERLQLRIRLFCCELKLFYPDYKNYYYLPAEDVAIHKSVAFYVDKEYRRQAKASDCYSRKMGMFLPEYEKVIVPCFQREYQEKMYYIECRDGFLENVESVHDYAVHVIEWIRKGKVECHDLYRYSIH